MFLIMKQNNHYCASKMPCLNKREIKPKGAANKISSITSALLRERI